MAPSCCCEGKYNNSHYTQKVPFSLLSLGVVGILLLDSSNMPDLPALWGGPLLGAGQPIFYIFIVVCSMSSLLKWTPTKLILTTTPRYKGICSGRRSNISGHNLFSYAARQPVFWLGLIYMTNVGQFNLNQIYLWHYS